MTFSDLIKTRRSVRSYRQDPVPEQLLNQVLEAGRLAPSACNIQPWHFIVLKGPDRISKLKASYDREWLLSAPVVIIVCIDHQKSWKRRDNKDFGDIDATIAMDHMILQATELGLGTCWIGAFNKEELTKVIDIPENIEPIVMTPLGFPLLIPEVKLRKKIEDIVRIL